MAIRQGKGAGDRRWAVGVTALFGGFVLFMLVCVGISSLQDYQLVEADYYRKGLGYQDRIDGLNRAHALTTDLEITYLSAVQAVIIDFPPAFAVDSIDGEIILYRPSNARWDQRYQIKPDSNRRQVVEVTKLPAGWWRVKVDWSDGRQRYYYETALVLGE